MLDGSILIITISNINIKIKDNRTNESTMVLGAISHMLYIHLNITTVTSRTLICPILSLIFISILRVLYYLFNSIYNLGSNFFSLILITIYLSTYIKVMFDLFNRQNRIF